VIWEVDEDEETIEGLDENGKPDPAYAEALGLVRAPYGRRAVAALIDLAFYLLLQVPYWVFALPLLLRLLQGRISWYGFVNHPQFILAVVMASISFALSLAYCVVQLVMHGRKGVTIGKRMMGIRTVNVKTLQRPGFWRMALRMLVLSASAVVVIGPVLFLTSPLFDPQKRGRGWHDMVGQNWYVDVRNGLFPYDEKKMRVARKLITAEPVAKSKEMPSLATPAGSNQDSGYRPAGRVSAGVLGVARPHTGARTAVGLTGIEEADDHPEELPTPAPGKPALGSYRRPKKDREDDPAPTTSERATPANQEVSSSPQQSTGSVPAMPVVPAPSAPPSAPMPPSSKPTGSSPGPPPASPVPGVVASAGSASPSTAGAAGLVTGPPWKAPDDNVEMTRMRSEQQFFLRLDTGERFEVTEVLMIGRNPSATTGERVLALDDHTRSVSKTHLSIRPLEEGLEVTDRHSTNGTAIIRNGVEQSLSAKDPVLALPGDKVRFGERMAVVERA